MVFISACAGAFVPFLRFHQQKARTAAIQNNGTNTLGTTIGARLVLEDSSAFPQSGTHVPVPLHRPPSVHEPRLHC